MLLMADLRDRPNPGLGYRLGNIHNFILHIEVNYDRHEGKGAIHFSGTCVTEV